MYHREPGASGGSSPYDKIFSHNTGRRYMPNLATLGREKRWRLAMVEAVAPRAGELVLDLAAGTGTSSDPLRKTGARVISTDLSFGMVSPDKHMHPNVDFPIGNELHLPFRDEAFDASTISFGLRSTPNTETALEELFRVTRSGGTLVICEFSTPNNKLFRAAYRQLLNHEAPKLADSVRDWPNQEKLASRMEDAGWIDIEWRNLTGGIVALHRAQKP